ncbi:MAG: hypothetical protein H0V11_06145 [Actinobacteria bacterium]|nr:hypothetical protein [Actinomycetota bacterium]
MRPSVALAVAGAVVAALVVALVVLMGRADSSGEAPTLSGALLSTASSFEPRAHLFGEPVTARLDVTFDSTRVEPDSVQATPRFDPYTIASRSESRESVGGITRVRTEYVLECLTRKCLAPKSGFLEVPRSRVEYKPRALRDPLIASVDWPPVRTASRVGVKELEGLELLADVRDLPPVSYRVAPSTVSAVGYGLAVLLGIAGLVLLARALALPTLVASALARRRARLSPLQRALNLVKRSTERGERADSRRALERLAVELRQTEEPGLARTATRLAWRRSDPSGSTVDPLFDEVERVIAEEAR